MGKMWLLSVLVLLLLSSSSSAAAGHVQESATLTRTVR